MNASSRFALISPIFAFWEDFLGNGKIFIFSISDYQCIRNPLGRFLICREYPSFCTFAASEPQKDIPMRKLLSIVLLLISAAMNAAADVPPPPTPTPPPPDTIPIDDDNGKGKGKNRSAAIWIPQAIYDAYANEVIFSCIIDEGETWLMDSFGQTVGYYAGLNGEISTLGLPAGQYTIVFVLDGAQASGTFTIRN